MEKTQLSMVAIEVEIEMCKNLIQKFKEELEDLTEKVKLITDRIKVMQAVQEMLPEGSTKAINEANINIAADERLELVPQIKKKQNAIKHYEEILECLIELKNEHEKND